MGNTKIVSPLFILASSSPRRLQLLADIGIVPDKIVAAEIDETPRHGELPRQLAVRLAYEKLMAVSAREAEGVILAADTVVACGRRVLPKAESADDVAECLRLLSGRRHHVYTAVAMRTSQGKILQRLCDSVVTFQRMTSADIAAYVASGEGIGKAGGYAIQGLTARHIRYLGGSYSNVVGLPLFEVAQMLKGAL